VEEASECAVCEAKPDRKSQAKGALNWEADRKFNMANRLQIDVRFFAGHRARIFFNGRCDFSTTRPTTVSGPAQC
jgi:hypothetical protein